jgi:hypothetical protein
MERKQMIVQRAREFFGQRLDEVLHRVRQDRQELRGWQEPAHLRAVLRRAVQERATLAANAATVAVAEPDIGHGPGSPTRASSAKRSGKSWMRGLPPWKSSWLPRRPS